MNYGVILASGSGTRMKNINVPKQYYEIGKKPIILYTIESMLSSKLFEYIYIVIKKDYENLLHNYLDKFVPNQDNIKIVYGGKERIDSIHNVLKEIAKNNINNDDIILIHDAVRPFVSKRVLKDSIEGAKENGAVVAVVPVADTMMISKDGKTVDSIPDRKILYKGQAPESFKLSKLIELENNLSDEQKKQITGTAQIYTMNGYQMKTTIGDDLNFKITTDSDLELAKSIIMYKKSVK